MVVSGNEANVPVDAVAMEVVRQISTTVNDHSML